MTKIKDITFEFTPENELKIMNTGDTRYILRFTDPRDGFLGYSNFHFNKFVWVESKMSIWPNQPTLIDVILLSKNDKIHVRVDFEKNTFTDITLYEKVIDSMVKPYEISIIIPAYKSTEYLEDVIDRFIKQMNNISDINYEILVGIDNCYETLEKVSQSDFKDNVKFYFFKENVGPYFVKNSLTVNATYKNIIFFDSDDIPKENLVREVAIKLSQFDIVRYHYNELFDGRDPDEFPNYGLHVGSFAIKKNTFIELGGFYPWRIAADTEFKNRCERLNIPTEIIEDCLMYYRIQGEENQLTRNNFSGYGSKLRTMYEKIIMDNKLNDNFHNPEEIKTVPYIRVF
jgi:hypothetical protein